MPLASTQPFTIPPTPLDPNTVGLLHFETNFFDEYLGKEWTALGNPDPDPGPIISNAQAQFGAESGLFNDNLIRVTGADRTQLEWGTGPFTMEGWIYPTATGATFGRTIFDFRPVPGSNGPYPCLKFGVGGSGGLIFFVNNGSQITGSTSITLNTWHHVAVAREGNLGSTTRLFLDGSIEGSFIDNFTYLTGEAAIGHSAFRISAGAQVSFIGHIDEVRFSNTARYTTAFTPTGPLT